MISAARPRCPGPQAPMVDRRATRMPATTATDRGARRVAPAKMPATLTKRSPRSRLEPTRYPTIPATHALRWASERAAGFAERLVRQQPSPRRCPQRAITSSFPRVSTSRAVPARAALAPVATRIDAATTVQRSYVARQFLHSITRRDRAAAHALPVRANATIDFSSPPSAVSRRCWCFPGLLLAPGQLGQEGAWQSH
jgi:hypothetical protein